LLTHLRTFARDRSGSAALYSGVIIFVLFLVVGISTDVGRSISVRTQLQRAADSAALAGAAAYTNTGASAAATTAATNYMNSAIAQLRSAGTVTFNVALSTKSQSGSVTDFIVTVTATAQVPTVLMTAYTSNLTAGVSATADNPVFNLKITLSSFSSSAADGNAIYYYTVPADGGTPSTKTQIFNNYLTTCSTNLWLYGLSSYAGSNSSATSVTVSLTAGQKIGFSLVNITGCNVPYKPNGYGSTLMNVNTMYSHMFPPSKIAYPSVTQNCSLQASTTNSETPGACSSSTPTPGALSCANNLGVNFYYYWNDMGGFKDDLDYNDAVYQVTCSGVGSIYSGLVLTN
jgi:Flp pilus assembly protein TadG